MIDTKTTKAIEPARPSQTLFAQNQTHRNLLHPCTTPKTLVREIRVICCLSQVSKTWHSSVEFEAHLIPIQ